MKKEFRLRAGACLLALALCPNVIVGPDAGPFPDAIFRYMERPESQYGWTRLRRSAVGGGQVMCLRLVSQKWHGVVWEHALNVYQPEEIRFPRHMVLMVTGGSQPPRLPGRDDMGMPLKLAQLCGARVAVLHQVPNQPLLDNRKEDDLITETWLRYLETGDETWPLLFPMVKSAVKAMDALQELARAEWDEPIEGFVITGGSKRGWTSWLTPVVDQRVIATAPMVIDVLNFRPQMRHQRDTWGRYSEQIRDYSSKGLIVEGEETPRERHLRLMMDPYAYRGVLTLPKLLVNGTNDPYWVVDAMKFYWHDLVGPKYALQVPNAGHGLEGGRELVLRTIGAFFRHVCSGRHLPAVDWQRRDSDGAFCLEVLPSTRPRSAHLWVARSADLDFRDETWIAQPLTASSKRFTATVPRPSEGHVAFYVELRYVVDDVPYSLCTVIQRE